MRALGGLPEPASVEAVGLLIELALNEFYRSNYQAMHDWAGRAVSAAKVLGDAPLMAAALAMPALADAMTGASERARSHRADAAALVDSLSDGELSLRLDAAVWLAAAELYLDRYPEADLHARRALTLARATGRGELFLVLYQILGRVWYVRAKLAEVTELLDGAIEAARLLGTTQALAGNLFNRSVVAVAVGDLDSALAAAQESVELARDLDEGFVTAWAAVRLAGVLLETGQPVQAVELLLGRAGGEELTLIPGGWRVSCLELLTRCWLSLDRCSEAGRAAGLAEVAAAAVRLPLAAAWADRAAAAVALAHRATGSARPNAPLASADAAEEVGAPIEAALSRTLAGRALAQAGQNDRAVAELQRAAASVRRLRRAALPPTSAERELGKLGRRPHRRTRQGKTDGSGIASLTERELQVARLVVDRKTPEIAAELSSARRRSRPTCATSSTRSTSPTRVALAHAVERADRTARPRSG